MSKTEQLLEFQFPAKAEALSQMRQKLRKAIRPCCKTEDFLNCIVLAVGEACMNIIQHAYGKEDTGDIIIKLAKHDQQMVFHLTDFAHRKTKYEEMVSRPLDEVRPGGLGCHIINEIMDEVKIVECTADFCGNTLQMTKKIEH